MNILMISGTHPAAPHISGVRAGRFAAELARMGHHCVLICPPLPGNEAQATPGFDAHDWSAPLIVEADDPPPTSNGGIATLVSLFRFGGRRESFYRNAVAHGRAVLPAFRADIGWATFGSLEAVVALRTLAREQEFPWIFDDKDNPDIYIPRIARKLMAWRLRGHAALQTNSALHADAVQRWLGRPAELIYSGVDPCFFDSNSAPQPHRRYITLVGSLYYEQTVAEIVGTIADYNAASGKPPLGIVHLGTQGGWLANDRGVPVDAPGYVSPAEVAALCQHSVANLYVFFGRGFHHKLFELLACRRPVIAYGGELPESVAAAGLLHAPLALPTDAAGLTEALAEAEHHVPDPRMPDLFFTWPEQAGMIETTMRRLTA